MKKKPVSKDPLAEKIEEILTPYPDPMSRNDFRIVCHIGTRTSLYLLQSGLVPCKNNGKKTRCYKIAKKDVAEYSQIKYKDRVYSGCKSVDFLADGYDLIPLEKLYRKFTGGSLAVDTAHQGEIKNQIKFLVNFVEQTTGLQNFGQYLTSMLEIDAFFLNEDRHTNNIAVQYNAADDSDRGPFQIQISPE